MNVWLNIPANSKLIALLNQRISALDAVSDSFDVDSLYDSCARLKAVEQAIVVEVHCLAAEANLLQGGVK